MVLVRRTKIYPIQRVFQKGNRPISWAPHNMRLLHKGDLRRCFRDSSSVTYMSTLPVTSPFCVCLVPYSHLALSALLLILRAKSQHI